MATASRIPEPKPIVILVLTVAAVIGLAPRYADSATSSWYTFYSHTVRIILEGGGVGVAIGSAWTISGRFLIRIVSALVFGFAGHLLANGVFYDYWGYAGSFVSELQAFRTLIHGALLAALMIIGHEIHSRLRKNKARGLFAPLIYAALGAVAGGIFVNGYNEVLNTLEFYRDGLAYGAFFGLLQWLGMLVVLAIDRRQQRGSAEPVNMGGGSA